MIRIEALDSCVTVPSAKQTKRGGTRLIVLAKLRLINENVAPVSTRAAVYNNPFESCNWHSTKLGSGAEVKMDGSTLLNSKGTLRHCRFVAMLSTACTAAMDEGTPVGRRTPRGRLHLLTGALEAERGLYIAECRTR